MKLRCPTRLSPVVHFAVTTAAISLAAACAGDDNALMGSPALAPSGSTPPTDVTTAGPAPAPTAGVSPELPNTREPVNTPTPAPLPAGCESLPGADALPPASNLRRLAWEEMHAALTDLFPATTTEEMAALVDDGAAPERRPEALLPNETFLRSMRPAVASFAKRAVLELKAQCPGADLACQTEQLLAVAKKAWRSNLDEGRDLALATKFAEFFQTDAERALEAGLTLVLGSPQFLFVMEPGSLVTDVPSGDLFAAGGERLAGLLAATLWVSVPDDALLAAAASGSLDTTEGLRAEVERMLDDPKAKRGVATFFRSWLGHNAVLKSVKSPEHFPAFNEELKREMMLDTEQTLSDLVFTHNAPPDALFTSTLGHPGPSMVAALGWDGIAPGATDLTAVGRFGLPTHPTFLAMTSADETSIVRRGQFLVERFACGLVPEPPPTVDTENQVTEHPDGRPLTAREQAELHAAEPGCAGCHKFLDPFGVPFETFDPIGASRSEDRGMPIDTTTTVDNVFGISATFQGPRDLLQALADSGQAERCFASHYTKFNLRGAPIEEAQLCALTDNPAAPGTIPSMREMILRFVMSDLYLKRTSPVHSESSAAEPVEN